MKLEEQFTDIIFDVIHINCNSKDPINKYLEITRTFAVGFAEWCNGNYGFDVGSWVKYENGKFNRYSTKQLLEIYEKTL